MRIHNLLSNMRLLHAKTLRLEVFFGSYKPLYTILSHIWCDDEVLFGDICDGLKRSGDGEV